ncbi:AraC family transcriptional regulator [Paractinoplanes globisporus]|uniref:Cupin domain-containing protein n=1 Tax=Paractinoplanes globisporus TaxID=113565 RepID=A0ABW6WIC9_9ACTN|nr:AraC family transcriptional regulator [Actinoplanes globisporus]
MSVRETTVSVQAPVDVLSLLLRELRFESAAYRWLELGAPYRVRFDHPGLRGVHIVARGGCALVLDDGTATPLGEGDLVILPGGDRHELRSPPAVDSLAVPVVSGLDVAMRTPGTRLRIGASAADTVVVCGAFLVGEPDHPALRGLPAVIHVPGGSGLRPYLDALSAEAFDGGPGADLVMARLSDALLVRALRHHAQTVDRPGWLTGLRDPYVSRALAAIHADLGRQWTVAALARTAGLSRAAFAARFTERVGEPVIRYLQSARMQRARTLLRAERATIAAVAARVGYSSDVAFAAAFRRHVGCTPGQWRQSVLGVALPTD